MRRLVCVTLIFAVTAACLACGGSNSGGNPSPTSTETPVPTPTPPPATFLYVNGFSTSGIQGYRVDETSGDLTPVSLQIASSPSTAGKVAAHAFGAFIYNLTNGSTARSYQLTAYQVDAHTGALSPIENSMAPAQGVGNLVADPRGEFLYYVDGCHHGDPAPCANHLRVLRVDKSTGALLGEAPGSPFTVGDHCGDPRVHPSGDFVYVQGAVVGSSWDYRLWGFRVDRAAGTLVPAPGSPFGWPDGTGAQTVVFHPTRPFVFVRDASWSPVGIQAYRIDPQSGALSEAAPRLFLAYCGGMTTDPAGKYLYVARGTGVLNANVSLMVYAIDASTGALTETRTVIAKTPGFIPWGVLVHPSGRLLFVWEVDEGVYQLIRLRAFAIDAQTAALTEVQGSPFRLDGKPRLEDDVPEQLRFLHNSKWVFALPNGFINRLAVTTEPPSVTALASFPVTSESFAFCDTRPN
jgi:6-phosphogluconolactonase (cycloisomerase 2 family)